MPSPRRRSVAASSTTLVYWALRAPPRDGRRQWLLKSTTQSPNLGNKMMPVCAATPPETLCPDARPNYERFGPNNAGSGDGTRCLALRYSLLSESAAFALADSESYKVVGNQRLIG